MDVIVTTPKSEHETAQHEAAIIKDDPSAFWFRTLRGKVKVNIGDRVYYVDDDFIRGYGVVFGIDVGEMLDDAHDRSWSGTHLKQREWVWLKKPFPMKGFQGFRYIRDEALRKALLDAEK